MRIPTPRRRRPRAPVETYGERALRVALGQVGVKEEPAGSNSGFQVRRYQAATSLGGTGWPWCAGFYHWCYRQAGAWQPYRSASVPAMLSWFRDRGRVIGRAEVRPGDAVMFDWQHDGTPDHIGLFRRWMDHWHMEFESVEGNTAVGNDSNGGQVMIRLRHVSNVAAFGRPVASRLRFGTRFNSYTGQPTRRVLHPSTWRKKRR